MNRRSFLKIAGGVAASLVVRRKIAAVPVPPPVAPLLLGEWRKGFTTGTSVMYGDVPCRDQHLIIESTPNGGSNHFYRMWRDSQ